MLNFTVIGELGGCGSPKNSKFKTFLPCTGYMIHQSTWNLVWNSILQVRYRMANFRQVS